MIITFLNSSKAALIITLTIIFVAGALSYSVIKEVDRTDGQLEDSRKILSLVTDVLINSHEADGSLRSFLVSRSPDSINSFYRSEARIRENIENLKTTSSTFFGYQNQMSELTDLVEQKLAKMNHAIAQRAVRDFNQQEIFMVEIENFRETEGVRKLVKEIEDMETLLLKTRLSLRAEQLWKLRVSLLVCLLLAIITAISAFVFFRKHLFNRKKVEDILRETKQKFEIRSQQLQQLTDTSLKINAALSVESVMNIGNKKAREIIGAHRSVTKLTLSEETGESIHAISMSDKYSAWKDDTVEPDELGLYAAVLKNRTLRLNQEEIKKHPMLRKFRKYVDEHPPIRGILAVPLVDREGQNIGMMMLSDKYEGEFSEEDEAFLIQIAQVIAVAAENAKLYRQVQESGRAKDEFLAVLSHELRTPLGVILGYSEMLKDLDPKSIQFRHALESIDRNAKIQAQLVGDILEVSRIITGKLSLEITAFDVKQIVNAAMESVQFAAISKGVRLNSRISDDVRHLKGDPNRIQQVLWNLLANSVKFTPRGGVIDLSVSNIDGFIEFIVSDTGKGIGANQLPRVFDRFWQEDTSKTRKHGGLGLGLAIVRHITELHGGVAFVQSKGEDQGTIFTVRIPVDCENAQSAILRSDISNLEFSREFHKINGAKSNKNVLIIDDHRDARTLIRSILNFEGVEVCEASSAKEALDLLNKRHSIDLVFCDISMPEMDGYEFICELRKREENTDRPRLYVVALTAFAFESDRKRALEEGFDAHLSKPVMREQLLALVHNSDKPNNQSLYQILH